jgi:hypothetical protein
MSNRASRRDRYNINRAAFMADQQANQPAPAPQPAAQQVQPQQGAIDPQMQMLITAMSHAFAQIPAFQQPAPVPAPVPVSAPTQIIQQLPTNAVKVPTFYGTVPDPVDAKAKVRCSPAAVTSCLTRLDVFFDTYSRLYPTDDMKLNAIVGCFPPNSTAQQWYDSDGGRRSMTTYVEFKRKFESRFGATAADVAKYQRDFFHVQQGRNESVGSFYTRYLQLLSEMTAIGKPVDSVTQIARFVDGLLPALRTNVSRIHRHNPTMTLDDVASEAEMEEKATPSPKPPVMPSVRGIQTKPKPKHCWFCKGDKGKNHVADNCPEIAKRKANGTWVDRPRKGAGGHS